MMIRRLRISPRPPIPRLFRPSRGYHWGTKAYFDCFPTPQHVDTTAIRQATINYLRKFDASLWTSDPIQTSIAGVKATGGKLVDTIDANGAVNGKQYIADEATFKSILNHIQNLVDEGQQGKQSEDLRTAVRRVEAEILDVAHAAELVGNQAIDFRKQDGITEIEESVQANAVERNLNDSLLADEAVGSVVIHRVPALVTCVSNFSNFLDLCRKVIRNIEVGVPVVVLARSNTQQHCYRWFQKLDMLLDQASVPRKMLSFASVDVVQTREIMTKFAMCPVYFTGSREVARAIKAINPKAICSTGGPNTIVATSLTPEVARAVRDSACIENSGQCTALRHLVVPECTQNDVEEKIFTGVTTVKDPLQSLEEGAFAAIFDTTKLNPKPGYDKHPVHPVAYRVSETLPVNIQENWREVYLDVTKASSLESSLTLDSICQWVREEQPISVSVNGPVDLGCTIWEKTGQVVFTTGSLEQPAMSVQARPQDGECFGELPPRSQLKEHTRFPVLIPSPTAGYNSSYNPMHLEKTSSTPPPAPFDYCSKALGALKDPVVKGFCIEILRFLEEATQGPWEGKGDRTCLFGVQRPPLGQKVILRVSKEASLDDMMPFILPFYATNARSQLEISVEPSAAVLKKLDELNLVGITVLHEEAGEFQMRKSKEGQSIYHVMTPDIETEFPLVGHFLSTLFVFGHCKTVLPGSLCLPSSSRLLYC
mmetsp:Transcript_9662/g.15121  ORF Transcript_9662/g.15121 Transcript_9662/m.15121 type:complete len:710 (+) Transcript_9662:156-2285(+)